MRTPHDDLFPVLLLEPNPASAAQLVSVLVAAGFRVHSEATAESALQALHETFFFALTVVADLSDKDCLAALAALRRRAPRSRMIVATPHCDAHACNLIHRHGGDACVALPISAEDLISRLEAFQSRPRTSF